MNTRAKPLTISRVAELASVSVETIRYYQRIGLLQEPDKPQQGFRVYPESTVSRLHFVQRAKQLGFTLQEIQQLLSLETEQCQQTRELAQRKIELIEAKLADLQAMRTTLQTLVNACEDNASHCGCPIIETLSSD